MTTSNSPLDDYKEQIEQWLDEGKSYGSIVRKLLALDVVTSDRSLRRAVRRWDRPGPLKGAEEPSFSYNREKDEVDITSDPRHWKSYLNGVDDLLTERGLDPDEWEIKNIFVNEWDSCMADGITLKQLKVHCVRKKTFNIIVPARVALDAKWFTPYEPIEGEPELVVFVGDQQAPFHDKDLHARFCAFLHDQEPERAVLMGDTIDLPTISRHPRDPDRDAEVQECVNAGCQIIVDYRQSSPGTRWFKLPGNHEERLRRIVIDQLGDFYNLTPAQVQSLPDLPPFYDPVYLLRLDELEVQYIRPQGNYKYATLAITPYLQAKHGDVARKGSGASALATLDSLDHSVVIGHTHRQSLVQKAIQQIDGSGRLLQAGETGCMCRIEGGLGYTPTPDWSNGFMTASVWPDGTFKLDLATYVDNHLYWRNERY